MSTISVDIPVLPAAQEYCPAPALGALAAPKATERNPTLDAARAMAAVGLVWLHTMENSITFKHASVLGRYGTSFFILASLFFLLRRGPRPDEGFRQYMLARLRRLYVPFLGWSAIYLTSRIIDFYFFSGPQIPDLRPLHLLGGMSGQLWFLPFILLAGLSCYPLRFVIPKLEVRGALLLAGAMILTGAIFSLIPVPDIATTLDGKKLVISYWTFLPSVFWAIAVVTLYLKLPRTITTSPWMAALGAVLVLSSIGLMFVYGIHPLGRNLAGLGLFTFALVPSRFFVFSGLASVGRLSFGIYLAHPLVIGACNSLAHLSHLAHRWWMDLLVFAAAFLCSFLLTLLLRSNRVTRWLIP